LKRGGAVPPQLQSKFLFRVEVVSPEKT